MTFVLEIIKLGLGNLRRHKLRSFLTALGIILGVAAVITNASIGEGSKRQALEQLERLGARNIIIRSTKPPESATAGGRQGLLSRYGLTRADLKVIQDEFPTATAIVPLKAVGGQLLRENLRRTSQAYGTTPDLLEAANLRLARGRYLSNEDVDEKAMVGVIGWELARALFPFDDPLGATVRIDAKPVKIIGVLQPVGLSGGAGGALVGRDINFDLHIPISTAEVVFGDVIARQTTREFSAIQISEVFIVAPDRELVLDFAKLAERVVATRHPGMTDVTMIVPYELLENARRNAMTWNLVLGSIAGISLLVGGIGIMNIMLASVTERTREIGIRRALGATRKHIVWQFLVETGVLSTIGGLIGVAGGLSFSLFVGYIVPKLHEIPIIGGYFQRDAALPTHITLWSVLVAFTVAALTGLIFGLYPAVKASRQDPIVALRHD
ncbi:MAG: ABC transporter permease [Phycisphaerae bacterium]|nr:ABC transporter permease [Phycisphaerae bacterium]